MADQKVSEIMESTLDKVKAMADSSTIIGERILVDDVTIIPISKLSFGVASGASDFGGKNNNPKSFAGGGGAGASVTPVGFLAIRNGDVKMIPVTQLETAASKAIEMLPDAFEKIKAMFKKPETDLAE